MRVAVLAEWYPSPADPVLGVWAHRQALATRDAGADVRVIALRRPVPPLAAARSALRGDTAPLRGWRAGVGGLLRSYEPDGIPVTSVPFLAPPRPLSYGTWGWWMAPPAARALHRLRAAWPFEVLHAHNVVPVGHAAARWVAAQARPPGVVVSTHGPDIIRDAHRSGLARRAAQAAFGAADLVLANSEWARRRCDEIAGRALPVRVVHLGTDVPATPPTRLAAPTIVTVAHLVARKRHAVVLRALAALAAAGDPVPDYLVIGDGPMRPELERLTAELGLGDRVTFTGQLDPEAALAEARRAHVFVMPGVEEPFGVAFVEAMAAGLPAIGARGEGGPEDIAAAGEGMVLVPPDDAGALASALRRLLGDAAERERLGAAARATVQAHFTWAACGAATLAAYESVARPA